MPFFCEKLKKSKKRSVTLQVRILKIKKHRNRKKVSLYASASLTLETALVLPMILFAGVILITLFQVMDVNRQVQAVMEHVSDEISQTAYLSKYTGDGKGLDTASAYGYAEVAVRGRLGDLPVEKVSLLHSRLLTDGETVDLIVDYEISMPFSILGSRTVKQTNRSYRRAWVGEHQSREDVEGDENSTIVYVGKNSSRYHVSKTCHYLYNNLTAVPIKEIENQRNGYGNRYSPCARCKNQTVTMVYIMPSGRRYHTTASCSAINAYVRAVEKSEVEYLGACSYCTGRK